MTAIRDTLHTDPDAVTKETVTEFIIGLFNRMGDRDYIGEPISQAEHGIQSAVMADQLEGKPSLTAAALLHDIGHYLHDFSEDSADAGIDSRHEDFGADFLARFFPPEVCEPVRLHVAAKRYLCAVEPDYLGGLSEASVHSLNLQGGPMEGDELETFAANPFLLDAITLRRCDDGAKIEDLAIPRIEDYRDLLEGLVVR